MVFALSAGRPDLLDLFRVLGFLLVSQGYDVMEEMYNEKTAAMNFVHELCKERPKGNLETFMALCIGVMNEYQVTGVHHVLLTR